MTAEDFMKSDEYKKDPDKYRYVEVDIPTLVFDELAKKTGTTDHQEIITKVIDYYIADEEKPKQI